MFSFFDIISNLLNFIFLIFRQKKFKGKLFNSVVGFFLILMLSKMRRVRVCRIDGVLQKTSVRAALQLGIPQVVDLNPAISYFYLLAFTYPLTQRCPLFAKNWIFDKFKVFWCVGFFTQNWSVFTEPNCLFSKFFRKIWNNFISYKK